MHNVAFFLKFKQALVYVWKPGRTQRYALKNVFQF